ncbi:MAG: SUMF1/EgtB/PvdO family nonheme iron enzyme [Kiritimatiellae bacterium]|nr:SUMF1/EgtB/PvdO family nonheme iron enzyme [Kiritimatiellia bacterium]
MRARFVAFAAVAAGVLFVVSAMTGNPAGGSSVGVGDSGAEGAETPVCCASEGTESGFVKVSWSAVDGASSYAVYRSETGERKNAEFLGSTDLLAFSDSSAAPGKTYTYFVKAKGVSGGDGFSKGATGWRGAVPSAPNAPEWVEVTQADASGVVLEWPAVSGATSYAVLRGAADEEHETVAVAAAPAYADTAAAPGVEYSYKVVARNGAGDSEPSAAVLARRPLGAPAVTATRDRADAVLLAWPAVEGASHYRVSRAEGEGDAVPLGGWQSETSFVDSSAAAGVAYTYRVQAALSGDGDFAGLESAGVEGCRKALGAAVAIEISGPPSVFAGGTASFVCRAVYEDGTTAVVTPDWSATAGEIATDGGYVAPTADESCEAVVSASYSAGGTTLTAEHAVEIPVDTGETIEVAELKATPRWPWNGLVDVDCRLESSAPGVAGTPALDLLNVDSGERIPLEDLSDQPKSSRIRTAGWYRTTVVATNSIGTTAVNSVVRAGNYVISLRRPVFPTALRLSLNPSGMMFLMHTQGVYRVSVSANCRWRVSSGNPWITVLPPARGVNNGTFEFHVDMNTGSLRNGTITVQSDEPSRITGQLTCTLRVCQDRWIPLYMLVDISSGGGSYPISFLGEPPEGGWRDEHKTDYIVLRKIDGDAFTMGATDEVGARDPDDLYTGRSNDNEDVHQVLLQGYFAGYYIGIFEITQYQYDRVTGMWPGLFNNLREMRPVECVSYEDIRGTQAGSTWPTTTNVDADSFMGLMRARTQNSIPGYVGVLPFDLPTEAVWEQACRATTQTPLNNGTWLTGYACANAENVARYRYTPGNDVYNANPGSSTNVGTAVVGTLQPNLWGLYDMHGNVWEWTLDWYQHHLGTSLAVDPVGPTNGTTRVVRGGSWDADANNVRSARRYDFAPGERRRSLGFRLCVYDNIGSGIGYSSPPAQSSIPPPRRAAMISDPDETNLTTLAWTAVEGATAYHVYRASEDDFSTARLVASVGPETLTYEDLSTPDGVSYYWIASADATGAQGAASSAGIGSGGGSAVTPGIPNNSSIQLRAQHVSGAGYTYAWTGELQTVGGGIDVWANADWYAHTTNAWISILPPARGGATGAVPRRFLYTLSPNISSSVRRGTIFVTATKTIVSGGRMRLTSRTVELAVEQKGVQYMVVDLANTNSVTFLSGVPSGGWTDEHRTTKLVLRGVEEGSFWMGSPAGETGRCMPSCSREDLHWVTLTRPFFIGVFPVTQQQYKLMMNGENPSMFAWSGRETCPVERLGLSRIRGAVSAHNWPVVRTVDGNSFMGRLRAHSGYSTFDLPTEAQWEYACRAGTATALNNGTNLTNAYQCPELNAVGHYSRGQYSNMNMPLPVGRYFPPNGWGIYDMHGNVCEWCLDRSQTSLGTAPVVDPVGPPSPGGASDLHVSRGGSFYDVAYFCRSANRSTYQPTDRFSRDGFRVVLTVPVTAPVFNFP